MKKSTKTILAVIMIIGVVTAIFLISYPPLIKNTATGTIGKVEVYKNPQINDKDVILRTNLLKDTSAIKNTIKDLAAFISFANTISSYIDFWWVPQLKNYSFPGCDKCIGNMLDYSDFIKNNNETLTKTLNLLAEYYKNPNSQTSDIEQQLISFGSYVSQMFKKDTVLDNTLFDIEQYVCSEDNPEFQRKDNIKKLKEIHDFMLLTVTQYAFSTGSKEKVLYAANRPIFNPDNIKKAINGNYVGMVYSNELNLAGNVQAAYGSALCVNSPGVTYMSANHVINNVTNLSHQGYCIFGNEHLNVVLCLQGNEGVNVSQVNIAQEVNLVVNAVLGVPVSGSGQINSVNLNFVCSAITLCSQNSYNFFNHEISAVSGVTANGGVNMVVGAILNSNTGIEAYLGSNGYQVFAANGPLLNALLGTNQLGIFAQDHYNLVGVQSIE